MSHVQRSQAASRRLAFVWLCVAACLGVLGYTEHVSTQAAQGDADRIWSPDLGGVAPGEIEVVPVQGNVHVLVGAGANITVQSGADGVLIVDTGIASMSDDIIEAVRSISPNPIRYIVNTIEWEDHTGGNGAIADVGETIPFRAPDYTAGPQGALDVSRASLIAYYTVLHRMSAPTGQAAPTPEEGWPDNTFSTSQKRLHFNDEPVVMMHRPANTDGNVMVFFRKSDVVSVGDILDLRAYPRIDLEAGGSLALMVDALNGVIDVAVPEANAGGGTMVIPGHGRVADHAEVVYYRDMMAIVRDRIQDMIDRGMTLEQVKAARPTRDWDARYGRTTGDWTTEMFVEAAYQSLSS